MLFLELAEHVLEVVMVYAQHNVGVHLDEAAVAVIGEAAVAGAGGEALDGFVVEAEVEDGVHHAGHRHPRAGAHGDEQGIGLVAEACADLRANPFQGIRDLGIETVRVGAVIGIVAGANLGGDGEAGRHGHAKLAHFGKVRALASEQIPVAGGAVCLAVAKAVNHLAGAGHHVCLGCV